MVPQHTIDQTGHGKLAMSQDHHPAGSRVLHFDKFADLSARRPLASAMSHHVGLEYMYVATMVCRVCGAWVTKFASNVDLVFLSTFCAFPLGRQYRNRILLIGKRTYSIPDPYMSPYTREMP
jgi:hypothetical protein